MQKTTTVDPHVTLRQGHLIDQLIGEAHTD